MKKTFNLIDLHCANCAAKMEREIGKINGVNDVSISFLTQKLNIEAQDELFDEIIKRAKKIIRKIEPECSIEL